MSSGYSTEEITGTPAEPARAKVVSTSPSRAKVFFEGLVKDARKFVEQNYPRAHIEPPGSPGDVPVPDVKLVHQDGSEEAYHAETGWTPVVKEGS